MKVLLLLLFYFFIKKKKNPGGVNVGYLLEWRVHVIVSTTYLYRSGPLQIIPSTQRELP